MGNHTATRARGRSSSASAGGSAGAGSGVAALHERSAQLQRAGGLPKEISPDEGRTPGKAGEAPKVSDLFGRLTPINHVPNYEVTLQGPTDPHLLVHAFGEHQLGAALSQRSVADLRKIADEQGLSHAGGKGDLVSRITAHVTQGRYSANFGTSTPRPAAAAAHPAAATPRAAASGPSPRIHEAESRARAAESRATSAERRVAQLERQLATLQAQHDALKAQVAGGSGGRTAGASKGTGKASGGLSEKNQAALNGPVPVPISRDGRDYSPSAKFDPYRLVVEYGQHQLRAVLARAIQMRLREAARIAMERNPGTKPTSLSSNEAMIDYIMQHVAPGY